jgi:hypothetical protein
LLIFDIGGITGFYVVGVGVGGDVGGDVGGVDVGGVDVGADVGVDALWVKFISWVDVFIGILLL